MATKIDPEKDYYRVLGVAADAGWFDIKRAFRQLAIKYHPDKNNGCQRAAAHFISVYEAYEVLDNPNLRSEYDRLRSARCHKTDWMYESSKDEKDQGKDANSHDASWSHASEDAESNDSTRTKSRTRAKTRSQSNSQPKESTHRPALKPTFSTFWTELRTMTPYFQNIRNSFEKAEKRHQEAKKALKFSLINWKHCCCRDLACRHSVTRDLAAKIEEARRAEREKKRIIWQDTKKIAIKLKAKKLEDERRVRMADKERQKASAKPR